jgi:hypothetical protein
MCRGNHAEVMRNQFLLRQLVTSAVTGGHTHFVLTGRGGDVVAVDGWELVPVAV